MKSKKTIIQEKILIEKSGAKGISIGKSTDGKAIFVQNAVPGDCVDVEIFRKKKNYEEGKAIYFHSYSKDRTEPKCVHFGVCGGCKWQNISYEKQLELKQSEVFGNIEKISGIIEFEKIAICGAKEQYYYRNKMEFSFSDSRWITQEEIESKQEIENRNALGFHIPKMWSKILDITECHLQHPLQNKIRKEIKDFSEKNNITFYNIMEEKGELRSLMLRNNSKNEWMLMLQFFEDNKPNREKLLTHLQKQFTELKSILYAINTKKNDSIYDLDIVLFDGEKFLNESIENLHFKIEAQSFFQTNYHQAIELYNITRDFANLTGNEIVYDLYTGTGTIAQFVAHQAKKVIGIESVPQAISSAKEYAKVNKIKNVSFFCGDMKDIFSDEFTQINGKPEVIITDPPRDGMHKKVVEHILHLAPQRIVYVSCNSATQARDIALLKEKYTLVKVQAVDMFPQTYHVESVALLELNTN